MKMPSAHSARPSTSRCACESAKAVRASATSADGCAPARAACSGRHVQVPARRTPPPRERVDRERARPLRCLVLAAIGEGPLPRCFRRPPPRTCVPRLRRPLVKFATQLTWKGMLPRGYLACSKGGNERWMGCIDLPACSWSRTTARSRKCCSARCVSRAMRSAAHATGPRRSRKAARSRPTS